MANYDEDSVTMAENGLSSKEIAKAVLYSPDPRPRNHQTLARLLGFDPKSQVQDSLRLTMVVIPDLIWIPCFVASREGGLLWRDPVTNQTRYRGNSCRRACGCCQGGGG